MTAHDPIREAFGLGHALHGCIGAAVTGLAERYKIAQPVRFTVVHKQPERTDMMHVCPVVATVLADASIPFSRLPLLGHPVRAAMVDRSPLKLGVFLPDPVGIATSARTEAIAPQRNKRRGTPELRATADAGKFIRGFSAGRHRCVLAGWRARLAATAPSTRRRQEKCLGAMAATERDCASHRAHKIGAAR